MLGWSKPVGTISLGFSYEETNIIDVWVSGAGEVCELFELGGSWSVTGKYGVCGAESSFLTKHLFQQFVVYGNFLYHGE